MVRICVRYIAVLCLLIPVSGIVLARLEQPLLQAGYLNTEDLTIAAGRTGTLDQELLNVWTWDAAIGLLCVLSFVAVPCGIALLLLTWNRRDPV